MPQHETDLAVLEDHGLQLEGAASTWTALAADVLRGLTAEHKHLPPKWFYDAHGSDLFDEICEQPEYYPTRAEAALLGAQGDDIAAAFDAKELVELGSGSSTKTPLLLRPLVSAGGLDRYVPVDVSASAIGIAERLLEEHFPGLVIERQILDFTTQLPLIGHAVEGGRLVALLGSTIGNLEPVEVQDFLTQLRSQLGPTDALLLGTDLVKDEATLVAAYNDAAGVTAAFNRNILTVINRELDADFDIEQFDHDASWNPELQRIETRLRSRGAQHVTIRALSLEIDFEPGEPIFTEISRKFTRQSVTELYARAGFKLSGWFEDDGVYALSLAVPV